VVKPRYQDVNPFVLELLRTGEWPRPNRHRDDLGAVHLAWECFQLCGPHATERLRQLWLELRAEILTDWIAETPGTRPEGWWEFDAPRWQLADRPARWRDLALTEFCEPRRRVGGTGTAQHDVLNVTPAFAFGIPTLWVSVFDEEYYNGRRRDLLGNPIGTDYHDGDFAGLAPRADDPPTFEAQATYLDRHDVLTPSERRVLTPRDFEPEPLEPPVDEDDDHSDAYVYEHFMPRPHRS
jgi:hypothetical protein